MAIAMLCFVKFRKHEALTYKENYKSLDLSGKWYLVDVDDVFVVDMDDGDYTKRDVDGKEVVLKYQNDFSVKTVDDLIKKEQTPAFNVIKANPILYAQTVAMYQPIFKAIDTIHGKKVYYFSTKEAAEDQVDYNMTTNDYYTKAGLFNSDNFAIDGDDTLVAYIGDKSDIRVPSEATDIAANTFSTDYNRAKNLKKVIVPSSVKTIEGYAFAFSKVETLYLSEGLTQINDNAFADSKLKDIHMPDSIDYLGEKMFGKMKGIKVHCSKDSDTYKFLMTHNENIEIVTD